MESVFPNKVRKSQLFIFIAKAFLSLIVAVAAFRYISYQIGYIDTKQIDVTDYWYLVFVAIAFMPINWLLEAYKYNVVLAKYHQCSMKDLLRMIFSGVTLGMVTPARLGEYPGRVLFLPDQSKLAGLLSTFMSSLSQLIIIIGLSAICTIIKSNKSSTHYNQLFDGVFEVIGFVLIGLLVAYILFNIVLNICIKFFKGADYLELIKEVSLKEKMKILCISFVRYCVYSIQFICLFYVFGVAIDLQDIIISVALIFGLQSLLPIPSIGDLVGRSGIALFVLSDYGVSLSVIIASTISLWLINLLIPSLLGLWYINTYKLNN